jgi:multicomponent Na+:H+ antiporter subunit B
VTQRLRLALLGTGLSILLALLLWGLHGVPPFGHYRGPYGQLVNAVGGRERHATNMVSAVNFDYRGFDTIGEEFILFVSGAGCAVVLRRQGDPKERTEPSGPTGATEATRTVALLSMAPLAVFGIYVIAHGHLTPGGGFQGGCITASAVVLVCLAGRCRTMRRVVPETLADLWDSVGAGGYVLVGLGGLAGGAAFLSNVLPLGTTGHLTSAGTMAVISLAIGLEVTGALLLIVNEFLNQLQRTPQEEDA